MSDYVSFAAHAFGPVIAKVAREDYGGVLTPALRRQCARKLNLSPAALEAALDRAEELLASEGPL